MEQKRYLLNFEAEAHGCLPKELSEIRSSHPNGDYEVWLSNLNVKPGTDRPLLSLQLIVSATYLSAANETGERKMDEYLNLLSLVTCLTFRPHRLIRIVDWTSGLTERDCMQYERVPGS
jgi:hypothetical protein